MKSVYERLGGADAVAAAVDIFYGKVLANPDLAQFFEGLDMHRMRAHQRAMLTAAFGGPNLYAGRDLATAHAGLLERGLDASHFDAVVDHLSSTLAELGVSADLVAEATEIAGSVKGQVLGHG